MLAQPLNIIVSTIIVMTIKNVFIDRHDELSYLDREYNDDSFKFISVIGRRRVGKTRLIEEFLRDKKDAVYFFVQELGDQELRLSFAERLHRELNISFLGIPSWETLFLELFNASENLRVIVVLDEFQRFLNINKSVPSIMQELIDRYARKSRLFLITMGSSIGMMHRLFDHTSALYGRRTGQLDIQPLSVLNLKEWFPGAPLEKIIEIYSVFGGTPKYLEEINPGKTIIENIKSEILSKKCILYSEPEILVKTELPDSVTYFNILKLISEGKTRPSEIASFLTVKQTSLGYFLNVLEKDMDLIKREVLVTEEKQERSKKAIYRIKDNFFRFWFRYVYPNKSDIEIDNLDIIFEKISRDLNSFIGRSFEDVCKEILLKLNRTPSIPFVFSKIGLWWGFYRNGSSRKELEIDIVTLNEITGEILFCECKWQDNVNARKVLAELKEKTKFVEWNKEKRKDYYAIFARSFKERIKEPGVILFELKDLKDA